MGEKGHMATCDRGEGVWLLPASRWEEYKLPPQILPRSVSHQQDWVRACKGGKPASSAISRTNRTPLMPAMNESFSGM